MGERKIDAVFEGGGIKGIGLVGAIAATEARGYCFEHVAGTSAGAIVASLVAAGYRADELKQILDNQDFNQFKDKGFEDKIPVIGSLLSLTFEKGIYEGNYFETWLRDLLKARNVHTFGDLVMPHCQHDPHYRYKLQVIASDISRGRMLVLPKDAIHYGILPDELDVARAVRMSMSIPFFFEPVILHDLNGKANYIVDGGILSNFPVWLFDAPSLNPPYPTFGYKLVDPIEQRSRTIQGPVSLLAALVSTMMEAHDIRYIEDNQFVRTIAIPTRGVQTTEFDLSPQRKTELYQAGVEAANQFFQIWDFEAYKQQYRVKKKTGRHKQLIRPDSLLAYWATSG